MTVNTSRSMRAELDAGVTDGRYMQLAPNWNTQSTAPQNEADRMDWPTYARVERGQVSPGWLVDSADRAAVHAHKARAAVDHYNNPTSGTRETLVDPAKYKFSQDQKGA
jgi:hypothetical protein